MRPLRRLPLAALLVCLGLGAIANLVVAWGCAARLNADDFAVRIVNQADRGAAGPMDLERLRTHPSARAFSDQQMLVGVEKRLGVERRLALAMPYWLAAASSETLVGGMSDPMIFEMRLRAGWPMHAFEGVRSEPAEPRFPQTSDGRWLDGFEYRGLARLGTREGPAMMGLAGALYPRCLLPYQPLWAGFTLNLLLYAVLAWLALFAPFALLRGLRRRGNRCERCGYPRGPSDRCSECGATL